MNRYKSVSMDVLVERAKELECIYLIDEALAGTCLPDMLQKVSEIVPVGFRNLNDCSVSVEFDGITYSAKPEVVNGDELQASIVVDGEKRGYIKAAYPKNIFPEGDTIFLEQEVKLLNTIAFRISESIYKKTIHDVNEYKRSWNTILQLLQRTDNEMLLYVCERMLAFLSDANPKLLSNIYKIMDWEEYDYRGEVNSPIDILLDIDAVRFSQVLFEYAAMCISDEQIYDSIRLWIYQGKTYEIAKIVNKKDSDVTSILRALNKYNITVKANEGSSEATNRWLTVELIRRFITDNPQIIATAQKYITIEDFCSLLRSFICSPRGIGKIGGKGAGLFIAHKIIQSQKQQNNSPDDILMPRTWYISSEELVNLIESNGLDELHEHKYKDIVEVRTSYPRIIQMMKNLKFSSYMYDELGKILDECADKPLIIRSSSLLEDQIDTSFSGKYKSLFITNIGSKAERLEQLSNAILEVYASIYNPDSIQYRKERDLLDCCEQMGIMIQEVVGQRVGPYYFPLYAGIAFSSNELRWSPRIRREDGLMRMVMGLGTRAVDRIGDDFPILISPGQPGLRVNQSPADIKKYSPQMLDAIDLEHNRFVTLPISQVIREYGNDIAHIGIVASVLKHDILTEANAITSDFTSDEFVITFDGLIKRSKMLSQVLSILSVLKEKLGYPVDIEFASDGENFYLLQCRPQSRNYDNAPIAIPTDISYQNTVFTGSKYVSNGRVTGIKTVVYVNPVKYSELAEYADYLRVGCAIREINRILPRRSFILMGPGRWGSRGDIKLGVPVAYSDINNTAMLIEIALRESRFQPELSFGTHFFQDLVEENIKYLPLYPEDSGIIFNQSFFNGTANALNDILPDYADLRDVIKVIEVDKEYYGKELFVLMNADLEKALAFIGDPSDYTADAIQNEPAYETGTEEGRGWKWRHYMAERIAQQIDFEAYSVKGVYLFGSTNNCTARLNSDIDLLIHIRGTKRQIKELDKWLSGWSLALSEINFLKTGYKTNGMLDVHYITDEDIKNKTSYAIKINSVYDPAFPLRLSDSE